MRYIDDVFIVCDETDGCVDSLVLQFNTLNPQLKFTCDQVDKEATFLDVNIKSTG